MLTATVLTSSAGIEGPHLETKCERFRGHLAAQQAKMDVNVSHFYRMNGPKIQSLVPRKIFPRCP